MRKLVAALAALMIAMVLVAGSAWAGPPKGWRVEDADGKFTFALPPTLQRTPEQGVDSFVRRYADERMELMFDFGPYSDSLKSYGDRPDHKVETVRIDGRDARIVTFANPAGASGGANPAFRHFAGVFIEDTGVPGMKLGMSAYAASAADQAVARQIFLSILLP